MAMNNSAQNTSQQRPVSAMNTVGNRQGYRDTERQKNYVLEQDWKKNKDWNSQIETEQELAARPVQNLTLINRAN